MDESPYAAPKAVVADAVPAGPPPARPPRMKTVLILAWTGFALLDIKSAWPLLFAPGGMGAYFLLAMCAGIVALLGANIGLGKGRNWARNLYFFLAARSLFAIPYMQVYFRRGGVQTLLGLFDIGIILVSLSGCALLLTPPARDWFREMKGR